MSLLEIRGVAKRFGATVALDGVDLTLEPGEVRALIGENGAGKSTLMNILAGGVRADRGEMEIEGRLYAPNSPLDARRRGIALIHQELSLCPHLTVAENILLGIEPSRWGWIDGDAARRRALALLEHFGHPDLHPDRRVGALPIAAQQVVEICRALAADARILLMDEPTSRFQRGCGSPVRADPGPRRSRDGGDPHQPFPRGSAGDRRPIQRAARRSERGRGRYRPSDERAPDRTDGGPQDGRAVSRSRPRTRWRSDPRRAGRRRAAGIEGSQLRAAARRDPRDRGADGIGPDGAGARTVRS